MQCAECGKQISPDELGLSKKLINRALTHGYCFACLAKKFSVTEELLRKKADQFRAAGCALFSPE